MILDGDLPDIDDIYIDGDKQKLGQVMRNLISNALKFTPSGGTVTVRAVSLTSRYLPAPAHRRSIKSYLVTEVASKVAPASPPMVPLWLKVEVSDTGAGISKVSDCSVLE